MSCWGGEWKRRTAAGGICNQYGCLPPAITCVWVPACLPARACARLCFVSCNKMFRAHTACWCSHNADPQHWRRIIGEAGLFHGGEVLLTLNWWSGWETFLAHKAPQTICDRPYLWAFKMLCITGRLISFDGPNSLTLSLSIWHYWQMNWNQRKGPKGGWMSAGVFHFVLLFIAPTGLETIGTIN